MIDLCRFDRESFLLRAIVDRPARRRDGHGDLLTIFTCVPALPGLLLLWRQASVDPFLLAARPRQRFTPVVLLHVLRMIDEPFHFFIVNFFSHALQIHLVLFSGCLGIHDNAGALLRQA